KRATLLTPPPVSTTNRPKFATQRGQPPASICGRLASRPGSCGSWRRRRGWRSPGSGRWRPAPTKRALRTSNTRSSCSQQRCRIDARRTVCCFLPPQPLLGGAFARKEGDDSMSDTTTTPAAPAPSGPEGLLTEPEMGTFDEAGEYTPRQVVADDL